VSNEKHEQPLNTMYLIWNQTNSIKINLNHFQLEKKFFEPFTYGNIMDRLVNMVMNLQVS